MNVRRLLLLVLCCFSSTLAVEGQKPWNDLKVMEENKLAPHTNVIPYADEESVERLAYLESPWCSSLNGVWKFKYVERPADVPSKFYKKKYDVSKWQEINVPGNIELQGYGVPVYVNESNEFEANPPYVPEDFNPVGCYVRDFEVPENWKGRRVVVKFGAVKSAMRLYVNGKYVGYSEDGKSPAEFDISKYVSTGKNRMALEVFRFCNGSYLECQDMWRMSGITRDVVLYTTPTSYITDYHAETSLKDLGNGTLRLTVYTRNAKGRKIEVQLKTDGKVVMCEQALVGNDGVVRIDKQFNKIKSWSEYAPNLYTLVIKLDESLRAADAMPTIVGGKIGFRSIAIVSGQLFFNQIPMKIKGVNRHEHSGYGGQYVTREEMEEDIRLMKAAGINAVRTSHYPDDEYWYELCDQYGIYVMDEANNESHGQGYAENSLAKKPEWADAMWYRVNNMYMRDRNHPCVFAWSLGNECGHGVCLEEAYKKLKSLEKVRPVCNERAEMGGSTSLVLTMYPSTSFLSNWAREEMKKPARERRPYIVAEYCHAMGNSEGGLQDYWDTIAKYPLLQGGFIWDWVDQSFVMDGHVRISGSKKADRAATPKTTVKKPGRQSLWYALGGDLGELPGVKDNGAFCANGLVTSDRRPHAHYYEVAAVYGKPKNPSVPKGQLQPMPSPQDMSVAKGPVAGKKASVQGGGLKELKVRGSSVSIDTTNGYIVSYKHEGEELLAAPIRYNFWRPPTLNDIVDRNGLKCWQGLDKMQCRFVKSANRRAPASNNPAIELEYLLLSNEDGYIMLKELVELDSDGLLNVNYVVSTNGSYRTLPKLGLQFGLDHSFGQTEWDGNSYETYPDRRTAQKWGTNRMPTNKVLGEMHPVPQESGNREAGRVVFSKGNRSLAVFSSEKVFSFSVRDYDDSVITKAERINQLIPAGHYVVNVDYKQAGLGTATCGPGVAEPYLVDGYSTYDYRFSFVPYDKSKVDVNKYNFLIGNRDGLTTDTVFTSRTAPGKSYVKKVRCNEKPDKRYNKKFSRNLHDLRKGVVGDWVEQWSGFNGKEQVVFTVELDSLRTISELEACMANAPSDWVVAPEKVTVAWSADGEKWSEPLELTLTNPMKDAQVESKRLHYKVSLNEVNAKVLKVSVKHCGILPEWHHFKGEPAWLMIDEIEVR